MKRRGFVATFVLPFFLAPVALAQGVKRRVERRKVWPYEYERRPHLFELRHQWWRRRTDRSTWHPCPTDVGCILEREHERRLLQRDIRYYPYIQSRDRKSPAMKAWEAYLERKR